ncbi:MAG: helix-turn-helix transcriptional regulator [Bacteroidales bacterium]|nr:helix-turn-helix transcriptional regulator [Bacteroidales bacterium]
MNINNLYEMSDRAIVRLIGNEIKRIRLEKNITQEKLSLESGIGRGFLSQIENGRPASLLTIIQVLRALQKLDLLKGFIYEPVISPMMLAKKQDEKRRRARNKKNEEDKTIKKSTW